MKLEPCKCGGTAYVYSDGWRVWFGVQCSSCLCKTKEYRSEREAIEEWNNKQKGAKQMAYYELCPKSDGYLPPTLESVRNSIGQLIRLEAECYADFHAKDDTEWERLVPEISRQIWDALNTKGIWYDEHGTPRFIKIEGNQKIKVED